MMGRAILRYIVLYCAILRYIALYCAIWRYIALYCDILRYIALYCAILRYTALYCAILRYILLYYVILRFIALYSSIFNAGTRPSWPMVHEPLCLRINWRPLSQCVKQSDPKHMCFTVESCAGRAGACTGAS